MSAKDRRAGDPAFQGSRAVTHEPVVEEERGSPLDRQRLRRPFPWAMAGIALAIVIAAIVSGAAAGWRYAIPFVVLAALILGFLALGRRRAREEPDDSDDPIPNLEFDEHTELGESPQRQDADRASHEDVERSTGRR